MTPACASCGHELAPGAAFCDECGTPVGRTAPPPAEAEAVRKTVTVLFCDLVGSTPFGERVDTESVRETLGRYHSMVQRAVDDRGGTVAKFIGDGVMAVFGVPEVAEDDAERAVAAGLELQRGFDAIESVVNARFGVGLGLRVGINSGEVIISDDDADLVGDVLNTAARLEAACEPGQVLVGEDTWRLTRSNIRYESLGEIELKGKSEGVAAFRAIDEAGSDDDAMTQFVGRDEELQRLLEVIDDAVSEREVRLATVIGAPGVGKTRLADELERAFAGDATFVDIRIDRAGGTTFAPIAELLRIAASLDDAHTSDEVLARIRSLVDDLDDAARVASLLASFVGAAEPRSTEELFFAVRRLLEAVGRTRSIVIVVDDIQWAEPLLLDLLEHLAEWVHDAPAVVLALARPELREIRPALAEKGRRVAEAISLEGLDAEATAELAALLVGAAALPGELLARLPESTEGNPLFVRELMRMLVDDNVIIEGEHGWELAIDAEAVEVPPTIQSLLSSRIERLPGPERRLLERASVVGADFPLGAVAALTPQGDAGRLIPILERLRRKELVEPTGAYWGNEPIFRFHHALIRDAAYRRLLKRTRSDHHLTVAAWMESSGTAVTGEHDTAIGYHLEQAHDLRVQLNLAGDETAEVGARAAETLGAAAQRALGRDDVAAASSLAARAVELLDEESADLPDLLMLGCEAFFTLGDVGAALPLLEQLEALINGDERLAAWVYALGAQLSVLTEPDRLVEAEAAAAAAAQALAQLDDRTGEANARLVRASALARLGHIGECEAELDKALTAARAADDGRRVATVLGAAPVAALWGPSPVPRAGGRCLDVLRLLRITTGSPRVEATSTRCQAVLEALRGRFDTARNMLADARSSVEELGDRHGLLETQLYWGFVELLAGDPEAAEPHLRAAYGGLGRLGIGADAGQAAAHLSRSLLLQGRLDEAADLAADSEALAGQNPQTAIAAKTARAELLAAQGRLDEALLVAEEAVARAEGTDILIDHAHANLALARVRSLAGDAEGTRNALTEAERLFTAKGASVNVDVEIPDQPQVDRAAPAPRTASSDHIPVDADEEMWSRADELTRAHLTAAVQGDWVVARESLADEVVLDDRRSMVSSVHRGADEVVVYWQAAAAVPVARRQRGEFATVFEPVACRGENLVLHRCTVGSGSPNAATQLHWLRLTEVDNGLITKITNFEPNDLLAAIEAIGLRYEELETDLVRLSNHRLTRMMYAALSSGDVDDALAFLGPNGELHDKRPLGWDVLGREELRERFQTIAALGGRANVYLARYRSNHPLYAWYDACVQIRDEAGGTLVDRQSIVVTGDSDTGVGGDAYQYGDDQIAEARSHFERLQRESRARGDLGNAATESSGHAHSWIRDGRWELVDQVVSPDLEVVGPTGDVASDPGRPLAEQATELGLVPSARRVLAVHGDRLVLTYLTFDEDGEERHLLAIEEIDETCRLSHIGQFETSELAEATHLIQRRSLEIEPSDWAETELQYVEFLHPNVDDAWLRENVASDFQFRDHRELGFGDGDLDHVRGIDASRSKVGGVPVPAEAIAIAEHAALSRVHSWRRRDSGALELAATPSLVLSRHSGGRIVGLEVFGEESLDEATARFEELAAIPTDSADESLHWADDLMHRSIDAVVRRDLVAAGELFTDDSRLEDRRAAVGSAHEGREAILEFWGGRFRGDAPLARDGETLATRGDDHVLHRGRIRTADGSLGASFEWLCLSVLRGRRIERMILFDPDHLAEAVAELDRLYLENVDDLAERNLVLKYGMIFSEVMDRSRDEEGTPSMASFLDDEYVQHDHRPLGWGTRDREGHLERVESLIADRGGVTGFLARISENRGVASRVEAHVVVSGPDREPVTDAQLMINEINPDTGLLLRTDRFGDDQTDETRRCWEDLETRTRGTVANVASMRGAAANTWAQRGDWEHFEWAIASDLVVVDADGTSLIDPDRTLREQAADLGFGVVGRRVLAVRREHLALVLHTNDDTRALRLEEVDDDCRICRITLFEPGQLPAAVREMERRWVEIEQPDEADMFTVLRDVSYPATGAPGADWLELHTEDFRLTDHRTMGYGSGDREWQLKVLTSRDPAAVVLAPVIWEHNEHGAITPLEGWHVTDAGQLELAAPAPAIGVFAVRDGRLAASEIFEWDDEDAARRRFVELTDPPSSSGDQHEPWNAADRLGRALLAAFEHDPTARRDAMSPDVVYRDERPFVGSTYRGVAEVEQAFAPGTMNLLEPETLASRGDRLVLFRQRRGIRGESSVEREQLTLHEYDENDLLARAVLYEPDQRAEAFAELDRLYIESDPGPLEVSTLAGWTRAFDIASDAPSLDDVEIMRANQHPDLEIVDHRQLGWPTQNREQFEERLRTLVEVGGHVTTSIARLLRTAPGLSLVEMATTVRWADGAVQQDRSFLLSEFDPSSSLITRTDQYAIEDLDEALEEFDRRLPDVEEAYSMSNVAVWEWNHLCSWRQSGHPRLVATALANEVVVEDETGGVVARGSESLAANPAIAGLGAAQRQTLAIRGDQLALVAVADDAEAFRSFVVVELNRRAELRRVRLFDWSVEGLTDATDYLEARWQEIGDLDDIDRLMMEAVAAWRHGDQDVLHRVLHEDFEVIDHRSFSWGDYTKETFISLFDGDARNVVVEVPAIHLGGSGSGRAFQLTAWGCSEDELIEALHGHFVFIARDGQVLRCDGHDIDTRDETLARLRELQVELGDVAEEGDVATEGDENDRDRAPAST